MKVAAWGIDLGTTNSCIARARADGVEVIRIDEALTVPSVLAHDGREFLVGRRAANYSVIAPDQAVRSIKRQMGDSTYRVQLGGAEMSPVDVSARILEYLKTQAERQTGETVDEAVITVPAWFNEPQRRATVEAGERAGLVVTRIVNEPTAAGLAYGHTGASRDAAPAGGSGERWLVYDLGGGTFDVSILSVAGNYKEVLASCGNTYLGGDDFDHRIVLRWVDVLRDRYNIDVSQDRIAMAQLRHLAEQTKIRLSSDVEAHAEAFIEIAGKRLQLDDVLTRAQFAMMIDDYVESTIAKARQALEEAHVASGQLSRVLLVGGSTRIPRIQQRVAQEFGIEPDAFVDVDLSVALGAAIQSALDHSLSSAQIVVDIAPHALGVAALGEEDEAALEHDLDGDGGTGADALRYPRTFVPVIRKNARLPAKFVEEFYTAVDGQKGVEVVVLQGESRNTRENTLVGAFHAPLAPKPARSIVCIGFEYDRNGMVRVSVGEQGGLKVLKSHTFDLSRSAQSNSEARSLHRLSSLGSGDEDDAGVTWDDEDDAHDWDGIGDHNGAATDAQALEVSSSPGTSSSAAHLTNFLIEQVERRLSGVAPGDLGDIRAALAEYRELLAAGRDDEIDEVEERLYAWLDDVRAGA